MNAAETKQKLRRWALATSNSLSREEALARSDSVIRRLNEVEEFRRARRIFVCLSFGQEVNTWGLINELIRDRHRRLCVPRVERDGVMHVHLYPCKLTPLRMGLQQPVPTEPEIPIEEVNTFIDVALVLGLAFERRRGYRLGHGKGYFDRFLAGKTFTTIGLSFESLLVDELPAQPHDVPMRMIVTEDRVYRYGDQNKAGL